MKCQEKSVAFWALFIVLYILAKANFAFGAYQRFILDFGYAQQLRTSKHGITWQTFAFVCSLVKYGFGGHDFTVSVYKESKTSEVNHGLSSQSQSAC